MCSWRERFRRKVTSEIRPTSRIHQLVQVEVGLVLLSNVSTIFGSSLRFKSQFDKTPKPHLPSDLDDTDLVEAHGSHLHLKGIGFTKAW